MFGYITADPRKLNRSAKNDYNALYCGLCRALSKRYGWIARYMLSFDTAFLLTMLESVKDGGDSCFGRCPYRFYTKRRCVCGENADYCADVTVLLTYLKLEDDERDERSLKARLLLKILKSKYKKASERRPRLAGLLDSHLRELARVERSGETNPDIPANIFGNLLADVFAKDERLRDFGFCLGRFIYLADAACDFKSDVKHARYNPLTRLRQADFYGMLARELGSCCEKYDALDISAYRDIIENVLYDGVWLKINLKGISDERSV